MLAPNRKSLHWGDPVTMAESSFGEKIQKPKLGELAHSCTCWFFVVFFVFWCFFSLCFFFFSFANT